MSCYFLLLIHDCVATFESNTIIKFADDTAMVCLIPDNNDKGYLRNVEDLTHWCQDNNLLLNISKTKELIVAFGKRRNRGGSTPPPPPNISGFSVERVDKVK